VAFDKGMAARLRDVFEGRADIVKKKMFGGFAFMHSGNMCCGIVNDILMARVGAENYAAALSKPFTREMDFTGKPLSGFVYVDPPGFSEERQLRDWVTLCEEFTSALPPK
jgi:TfoX/Sxy family transcriptional regulator of competence genes